MLKLRDYQQSVYGAIQKAWQTVLSVLVVLATGGGKTVIFSAVMHDHNGACAAVVHRKEIVSQISLSLAALEVKHRIIAPPKVVGLIRRKHLKRYGKSFIDPHARAGVVSVQTLTSRSSGKNRELQRWVKQITLCVFDEGHHYVSDGLWAKAVEMMGDIKLLFVTATPQRADGKGLGKWASGFVEKMIEGPSTRWLIERGYLSRFSYKAPETDLDVSNLVLTASGDINTKKFRSRIVDSSLVGDVVRHYFKFAAGKRTIVFANDVATAEEHARAFIKAGVKAVVLTGDTDGAVRDRELEAFEDGTGATVLINVDLFDEGFDVPAVEAVILARVTMSLAKFLQMIGRCLRPVYAPGFDLSTVAGRLAAMAAGAKPEAIVIDCVRNWERGHGMPDWPRVWSLGDQEKGSRSASDTVPQRVCGSCTQPYEAFYKVCPYCGFVPAIPERSTPDQVAGDLVELDTEAMAALFRQIDDADMSDEDYALGQISRKMPYIGRSPDLKRHQAAKYRRKVLKELMAWWFGVQPAGRSKSEQHKRFYFRFGIDIGTALTLNARETDALIQRIQDKFSEDMAT